MPPRRAPTRLRSRCVGAPGQVVEERQASPGVAAVASAFGEPGPVGAVDVDEAVANRNERARFEMAVDEAPPPEREIRPGDGVLEQEHGVEVRQVTP